MSPLALALIIFALWGVAPLVFLGLFIRDELARKRDDLEASWRLPAREPTRTQEMVEPGRIVLSVQAWTTECGACGYGRGGWTASPALEGKPVLTPHSRVCPDCEQAFTHVEDVYGGKLTALDEPRAAA